MSLEPQLTALMSRILSAISSAVVKSWIKKCYGARSERKFRKVRGGYDMNDAREK